MPNIHGVCSPKPLNSVRMVSTRPVKERISKTYDVQIVRGTGALSATISDDSTSADSRGSSPKLSNSRSFSSASKTLASKRGNALKTRNSAEFPPGIYDLHLISVFLEQAGYSNADADVVKRLLRALDLMRRCDYSAEDVCSTLAHASTYFPGIFNHCKHGLQPGETGYILTLLVYIAHCYVLDETCPLRVWHSLLFKDYCPLSKLNQAIVRLLQIRRYVLRVEPAHLAVLYDSLYAVVKEQKVSHQSAGACWP